jgi:hypothetical protein
MVSKAARRRNREKRVVKWIVIVGSLFLTVQAYQIKGRGSTLGPPAIKANVAEATNRKDDAGAREAFLAAYPVFMHPRCMNCHPAGDAPLQGDESRVHEQNVKRGPDGRGKYALKCANCHQKFNLEGEDMPPGSPNWHLPPPSMRMVFEGKSPSDLCRQLKDPRQNGGKTLAQLMRHVSDDKLVLWGWDPGDGRRKPQLSHVEFAQEIRKWVDKGAVCPD